MKLYVCARKIKFVRLMSSIIEIIFSVCVCFENSVAHFIIIYCFVLIYLFI